MKCGSFYRHDVDSLLGGWESLEKSIFEIKKNIVAAY